MRGFSLARSALCLFVVLWSWVFAAPPAAPNSALGESEAQKCEEKIASVRRDVLSRYDDALNELQVGFQKAADLEGALAVRAERQRVSTEQTLSDEDLVTEPKSLRTVQTQMLAKMHELTTQLLQETVPKLVELKRSLTVAGRLDEAVAVRAIIERLQTNHAPISRPQAGSIVTTDTLLQAYAADRARADKTYKGQKITVRGIIAGFRGDPADSKLFHVFLAGAGTSMVQCAFSTGEYRFREEQQFNNTFLIVTPKANESTTVRWQKGQITDIRGICDGFEEVVRITKCDLAR
jgi:hypothetical protein